MKIFHQSSEDFGKFVQIFNLNTIVAPRSLLLAEQNSLVEFCLAPGSMCCSMELIN